MQPAYRAHTDTPVLPRPQGLIARQTPGYAVGGLAGGEDKETFCRVVSQCTAVLPPGKPRYVMGIGCAPSVAVFGGETNVRSCLIVTPRLQTPLMGQTRSRHIACDCATPRLDELLCIVAPGSATRAPAAGIQWISSSVRH